MLMPSNPAALARTAVGLMVASAAAGYIVRNSDFSASLAGDYEIVQTSAHQVSITPKGGSSDGTPIIPSMVVEVAFDDRFILATRQHLKHRSQSPNDHYEEPVQGKFDYWILDTNGPSVTGPIDEAEFAIKWTELGISDQLQMQSASSLNPARLQRQ